MKLAFSTLQYGPICRNLLNIFDDIANAGFSGVEVTQAPSTLGLSPSQLQRELACRGLELTGLIFGSISERVNFLRDMGNKDPYVYVESWHPACDELEDFCFAMHPGQFRNMPNQATMRHEVERHPRIRLIIDAAHQFIMSEDAISNVSQFMDRVVAVHLKDWTSMYGRTLRRYQSGFCAIGDGDALQPVDGRNFVERLREISFDKWIVCESEPNKFDVSFTPAMVAKQLNDTMNIKLAQSHRTTPVKLIRQYVDSSLGEMAFKQLYEQLISTNVHDTDFFFSLLPEMLHSLVPSDYICVSLVDHRHRKLIPVVRHDFVNPLNPRNSVSTAAYSSEIFQQIGISKADGTLRIPVFNSANMTCCWLLIETSQPKSQLTFEDAWQISKAITITADNILIRRCAAVSDAVHTLKPRFQDLNEFLEQLVEILQEYVNCESATIFLVDVNRSKLKVGATTGLNWSSSETFYQELEGVTGTCWAMKEPIIFHAIENDKTSRRKSEERVKNQQNKQCALVPWVSQYSGKVFAVVRVRNKRPNNPIASFTNDDVSVIEAIGTAAISTLEQICDDSLHNVELGLLSHEIQEPLSQIRGVAANIKNAVSFAPAHDICNKISNWSSLISHEIAKADLFRRWHAVIAPTLDIVSLPRRFQKILCHCAPILNKVGIDSVQVDASSLDSAPSMHTDPEMVEEIFYNLLSNAIYFRKINHPCDHRIRICWSETSQHFNIDFHDNGVGFTCLTEQVFEPGFREPHAHLHFTEGEGLGLWVSKRLANALSGDVSIVQRSNPTIVRLRLAWDAE